jgi:DNA-binding beta-propeller fold protein YncE
LKRSTLSAYGMLALLPLAGCGEPVAVLGDTPGAMRIVAGIPNGSGETVAPLAVDARTADPSGLAILDDGRLLIVEKGNARALSVSSSGALDVVRADRFCAGTCLEAPADAALDASGRLIVADVGAHRVFRLDPNTGVLEVLAGTGLIGDSPDGTLATAADLDRPSGVAVDVDGTIYFTERGNHTIRFIDGAGAVQTLAGMGMPGFAGDGSAAAGSQLDTPGGLGLAAGILYVADSGNARVRAIDLDAGSITTLAGNGRAGFGGDGGPAVAASLNFPEDVTATPDGRRVFIADTRNHRVRHVPLDSGVIETFAGTGDTTFTGNLLDAGATSVSNPSGVAAGPFGFLFVSDPGHDVVWRVVLGF